VTPISLDHMQILGSTVAAIAAEKADVIKPGRICVCAPQPPEALAIIRRVAAERGAALRLVGADGARWTGPGELQTSAGPLADLRPSLRGPFQRVNIATAVSVVDALRDSGVGPISPEAVRTGVEQAVWPGRFEV